VLLQQLSHPVPLRPVLAEDCGCDELGANVGFGELFFIHARSSRQTFPTAVQCEAEAVAFSIVMRKFIDPKQETQVRIVQLGATDDRRPILALAYFSDNDATGSG
jgi:hypothetical protein